MDVYQAIADPSRRKMLDILAAGEQTVQDILPHFDVTAGAVSQHLKILLDTRLVTRRKDGRFRYYSATPGRLSEVHDWTKRFEKFWHGRLDALGDYLDENS